MNETKVRLGTLKCQKCGHTWYPRQMVVRACPNNKCQTRLWDRLQVKQEAKPDVVSAIVPASVKTEVMQ